MLTSHLHNNSPLSWFPDGPGRGCINSGVGGVRNHEYFTFLWELGIYMIKVSEMEVIG
jgi:hypothetical protein